MEGEESSTVGSRKRTESNGGSSDSDLSEGWNYVDEFDINTHDVPSSDGESVEVIDADNESQEQVTDSEVEPEVMLTDSQVAPKLVSPVVPANENEPPISTNVEQPPVQEEMFDSSFCWFLFFATSAVLVSNLAFMAAENALDWNMDVNIESPSFLWDLPVTPKPPQQNDFSDVNSWADNDEVIVETVDDISDDKSDKNIPYQSESDTERKVKYHKNSNGKWQTQSLKTDHHELGKYFKVLSDVTSSAEVQNKFVQSLLILDALRVGLNDVEEVVPENSELHHVLKKQKNKLHDVLTEIEFGLFRSVERLSTNVLNKVQQLERKFENQWCKLEKNGHKEELKGLFYDCQESKSADQIYEKKNTKYFKETKEQSNFEDKDTSTGKKRITMDDLHYAVDKDTNGKMYSKPSSWYKDNEDYYKFVKKDTLENELNIKENKREKSWKNGGKGKYTKVEKSKVYQTKKENPTFNKPETKVHTKNKKLTLAAEKVHKYPRKNSGKNTKNIKMAKNPKDYQSLKDNIDGKIRESKDMFDTLYEKYCKINYDSFKWDNKEYFKEAYSGKSNDKKNYDTIESYNQQLKNVVEIRIVETSKVNKIKPSSDSAQDKIIAPTNKPRQWILSYEGSSSDNKSNMSGEWFFKAGESRSRARLSHHRSDWWFERASHRRSHPHLSNGFSARRKNWFFRRAWARQQCRQSPHPSWCHPAEDETVTIPNPNSNFR